LEAKELDGWNKGNTHLLNIRGVRDSIFRASLQKLAKKTYCKIYKTVVI